MDEGIAIIGIGCIFPKADNKDIFWNNILNRVNAITDVPKEKWDSEVYYHPDRTMPDKTYSKIGAFVNSIDKKAMALKFKIPPKTFDSMDMAQTYAIAAAGEALEDSGYDKKDFNRERTAVIIGNSMGGDLIDYTNLRIFFGDIEKYLSKTKNFSGLDHKLKEEIIREFEQSFKGDLPEITEDSMPGELANVISGRIANIFNLNGPNFSVDAACASSLASLSESMKGLRMKEFDLVITGGSDYMMGPGPYVKFCKIGALSPDGSKPFDARANGFVMGEGTGIYILKRISDARRDGDKIYAVIRGVGASSDGKGKGITAPNPRGQIFAITRGLEYGGFDPFSVQYIEAHGTATTVGDATEMGSLCSIWNDKSLKAGSIGVSSVKSMIGHIKAAAGSASIIKTALALHHKIMPPSLNYNEPNPVIGFGKIPFRVITSPEEWPKGINGNPRRAGVNAFGFGGTNFHVSVEEDSGHNGMPVSVRKSYGTGIEFPEHGEEGVAALKELPVHPLSEPIKIQLEGEPVVIGGDSWDDIGKKADELIRLIGSKKSNGTYTIRLIDISAKLNPESNGKNFRLAVSADSLDDLAEKLAAAKQAFSDEKKWLFMANKGIFFGANLNGKKGNMGKMAFLFPGQGTQYLNMLNELYHKYQIVRDTFDEGDRIMLDILGERISGLIFIDGNADEKMKKAAEKKLRQTEVTQPSILISDYALYRLVKSFGINPDMVVGHSLGEYGALIAAGVMDFDSALHAVAARGKEIANVKIDDLGKMASISTDFPKVEEVLKTIDGYVIAANKNCYAQTVISGKSDSVLKAIDAFTKMGIQAVEIPVSHAFHSQIVAPAAAAYRKVLENTKISSPKIDIIGNIDAEYYPKGPDAPKKIVDKLVAHIANPVEFVSQIERMYRDGVRMYLELGPKKALTSYVQNVNDRKPIFAFATNHPKRGGVFSINDALAALSAYGYDIDWNGITADGRNMSAPDWRLTSQFLGRENPERAGKTARALAAKSAKEERADKDRQHLQPPSDYNLRHVHSHGISSDAIYRNFRERHENLFRDMLEEYSVKSSELMSDHLEEALYYKKEMELKNISLEKIMISGVAMGLPGMRSRVFDDGNFDRLANGENMIDFVSENIKNKIIEKNIYRLVKSSDSSAEFEVVRDKTEVIKLAGIKGLFDFEKDYGFREENTDALDTTTKLAIAAGIEALRDAGIPLVMNYKQTTTNTVLPTHWGLSESLSDETGIIFASAFPGYDSLIDEISRGLAYKYGTRAKRELIDLYSSLISKIDDIKTRDVLTGWYADNYSMLNDDVKGENIYTFNMKFLFKILSMGHSQFAELIKAKGPNIQLNSACSSTVTAIATAEDWIRTGRAKRVIIIAADDITTGATLDWFLSGFLALGAATTKDTIEEAAIPFDRRRNGMIVGMGAVGIVVEAESEIKKRGMEPIAEVIATEFLNSAFHGSRLDISHISQVMEKLISTAEKRMGIKRDVFARETLFMSHETYTPARGGSASAEIVSLKSTFGTNYSDVVISNTKGFTGHAMAAGIEDAVVIKALQTGKVPPIANYREPDPELGELNLSKGGSYPGLKYGLRLGAGFGSQIAMSFLKLVSRNATRITDRNLYLKWIGELSGLAHPEIEVVNRTLRVKADDSKFMKTAEARLSADAAAALETKAQAPEQKEIKAEAKVSAGTDIIKMKITGIVSDKTGYPRNLIEFDLDMESDLGIDTVKQAELFGSVREMFNIPRDESIQIKEFPTLNHVVQFVKDRSPQFAGMAAEPVAMAAPAAAVKAMAAGSAMDGVKKKIVKMVSDKTGYPENLIDFDLDMESDLGIDTVKQAELFGSVRDLFKIARDENLQIKDYPTLNHVVQFVMDRSPEITAHAAVMKEEIKTSPDFIQPAALKKADTMDGMTDMVRKKIGAAVSEKTGYPEDLIDFDLDMESDLGIDTVKQAELFGTVRDLFSIPRDENLLIKDYPTLNHIVKFVRERSPEFSASPAAMAAPVQVKDPEKVNKALPSGNIRRMITEAVESPLNKEKQTFSLEGLTILITSDGRGISGHLAGLLENSGSRVKVMGLDTISDDKALAAALDEISKSGPFDGIIHLAPLEESKALDEMTFDDWRKSVFRRVKSLFLIAKTMQDEIEKSAKSQKALIVSATPMGGTFGFEDFTAADPIGGGVAGLTKSLSKELGGVLVKVVDFSMKEKPSAIAKNLIDEIRYGGTRVETGYAGKKRMVTQVIYMDVDRESGSGFLLPENPVFAITGGGYGITSEVAKEIAGRFKPRIAIISRAGLPENAKELASLDDTGLKILKDKMVQELKSKHERVTPVMIEREFSRYTTAIEKYRNIEEMKKLGAAEVEYFPCDVSDNAEMKKTISDIEKKFGKIDVIIHGAGLEESKLMRDKKFGDFNKIFDIKADGCYNLMELTRGHDVKAVVIFGSISGRFGNNGQTDYAAANDLLNKYARHMNTRFHGKRRGISMNWAGWQDVGMATRGSIKKIFEEAGIDMIPMGEGVSRVSDELLYGGDSEVIIAGRVGPIDSGGLIAGDRSKALSEASDKIKNSRERYPMIDEILAFSPGRTMSARKNLNPDIDIYLKDHAIDTIPYFPAVMGIESFAEASDLLFPGMNIRAMRDIKFLVPIKIMKNKPVDIFITVTKKGVSGDDIILTASIETEFFNKDGIKLGDNKLHFHGEVVLSKEKFQMKKDSVDGKYKAVITEFKKSGKSLYDKKAIYKRFFHGPRFQVHGGVIDIMNREVLGALAVPDGEIFTFVKNPKFMTDPLAIESALQNSGIYSMSLMGIHSLPDAVGELKFKKIPDGAKDLMILSLFTGDEGDRQVYDTKIMDSAGNVFSEMKGYKMVKTGDLDEKLTFKVKGK